MSILTRFSLKNGAWILCSMILIVTGGIFSVSTMKVEMFPYANVPYLLVSVPYPGVNPEQGLESVGKPLEQALAGMTGLKNIYLTAKHDQVETILEFYDNQAMDEKEKEVKQVLSSISLPVEAKQPQVQRMDPTQGEIFSFGLVSDQADQEALRYIMEQRVKPLFASIQGISQIVLKGGAEKNLLIRIDPVKAKQKNLSYDETKQLLQANQVKIPAGQMESKEKNFHVIVDSRWKSADQLRNFRLMKNPAGPAVRLKEIAEIDYEEAYTERARVNGNPAVIGEIYAEPGSNAVEIIRQVRDKLAQFSLPTGYKFLTIHDSSVAIEKSVHQMWREALLGAAFTVLVTFIFLRHWRLTIVAVLSMPLSILATMIVLKWLNYSLNMMTIAGIAVATGRVVDDSIVVIENIYRRMTSNQQRNVTFILQATKEVGHAITSSTLTTIVAFVALLFVPGVIGRLFEPFAVAVIVSLFFSLVVAITFIPFFAYVFLRNIPACSKRKTIDLQDIYRRWLNWSFQRQWQLKVIAILLVVGSCLFIPFIPVHFLPNEKTGSYQLHITLPSGMTKEKAEKVMNRLDQYLLQQPDVKRFQSYLRDEEIRMQIELKDKRSKGETERFAANLKRFADQLGPGFRTAVSPLSMATSGGELFVIVNGSNDESLQQAGERMVREMNRIAGLTNIQTNWAEVKPQLEIDVNVKEANKRGLSAEMVVVAVRRMLEGEPLLQGSLYGQTMTKVGRNEVRIGMKLQSLKSVAALKQQTIPNIYGHPVPLFKVATIKEKSAPAAIYRLNQKKYLSITGRFTTDNTMAVQKEVEERLAQLRLPEDITYYFDGEAKKIDEGFSHMLIAMGASIVFVYLVMFFSFREAQAPLAILFSLPFIVVGGFLGLYITGEALGIPALVGFLMLIGIVVTNAIVLLDRVKQNRAEGMEVKQSLIEAGMTRLRPVLMTAIATVGALVPLAFSTESGLISRSMAIVVIFGLISSTLLTLVIVPLVYLGLERLRLRSNKLEKALQP
ncbi:efflux RND transporter permease subunit [Thermoflavimicrobium dichotomicum]|uniref:Hydrophobic/amphiphilic exporter-1, HAE1 family n=1 Tax=Thermoflavimicrobium dichotomicum TaxID=46223 RepID=A0A1I3LI35_9BACL|nr:efflux RND transporter permease subunit [Thermoflavimicrobium dichotomicum]SFI84423.1 hydrophobic/amphiphilic exporter-1, HAE1 family [Thermoflavimicrobium dichotomicum]